MGTQRALPAALLLLFPPHHARWPLFTAHHLCWGLHNMRPVNGPGGFGIGRCLHTMVKKGKDHRGGQHLFGTHLIAELCHGTDITASSTQRHIQTGARCDERAVVMPSKVAHLHNILTTLAVTRSTAKCRVNVVNSYEPV